MTRVELLQKEVNDMNNLIDKLDTISQQLEVDKMVLEDKLRSVNSFIDANIEDIAKREKEQKVLIAKLEKTKQEIQPLQGQLAFVNTGYKTVVEV